MNGFEEKLNRLEALSSDIRCSDISLEDALKDFEEGISLAKTLEKEIDKMEGKIQILINQPVKADPAKGIQETAPELDLFSKADAVTGSAGAPSEGLRQND